MYETEVNRIVESIDSLPPAIRAQLTGPHPRLAGRTLLPWGEHCTECNWPSCYTSCELYTPRADGGCRLFVDGMTRVDHEGGLNPYLLKIRFKRWGKLWTVGTTKLHPQSIAHRKEMLNLAVGAAARGLPLPSSLKRRVLQKVAYRRKLATEESAQAGDVPDYFLLECYNPNERLITLSLTIRPRFAKSLHPFQTIVNLPAGVTRHQMPLGEITAHLDLRQPFEVEIVPNECDNTVLYFAFLDFVKEQPAPAAGAPGQPAATPWKCLVWDLDHTLWQGVLVEDGPEKLRVNPVAVAVIHELDRRGILQSIASKNNHDEAMKVLRAAGLEEYYLYPQINWQPKSQSLARIAELLNIGVDTLAFIDDQPFERGEVQAALPKVAVIDAADCATIPVRPECQVPVTEESRQRRQMYRQQEQRVSTLRIYKGDYQKFLRDSGIELEIGRLTLENLERVYELAQRTNQMNFSGNRYPRPQLAELAASTAHETFVMKCRDRFGSYGTVGFAVVDLREPRLMDLMFSCRIQSKRVEHAFLTFLLDRFVRGRGQSLCATYRPTPKNEPSGKVFEEMGFLRESLHEGVLSLRFPAGLPVPDDGIISVRPDASF